MAAKAAVLEGYHEVAKLSDLRSSVRMRVSVEERVIALFYSEGRVYAMDHFCYRKSTKRPTSPWPIIYKVDQ